MTNQDAVNWLVKVITAGDNDLKGQVTAAKARRIAKTLSQELYSKGEHVYVTAGEGTAPGPEGVCHPAIAKLFENGKRLALKKK